MRFILFRHLVEIAQAIFQTTGKRCRIFTIGNTGMHLPICSFFRTRFIRGGHGLGFGFIRAKRVSNCYMREKKIDRLCGCVCGCTANLGFSVYVRMFLGFSVKNLSWF